MEARNGVSSADAAAFAEMESTLDAALAGLVDLTAFVKKVLDV